MKDYFARYHPMANFLFYMGILGITMFVMDIVFMIESFVAGAIYLGFCFDLKKLKKALLIAMPIVLLSIILNPIFNHEGATILAYLRSGGPITLEAVTFGFVSGLMMATSIIWFASLNEVITTDKITYLFGKLLPAFALMISIALGFMPKFLKQMKMAGDGQRMLHQGEYEEVALSRDKRKVMDSKLKRGIALFSIMVTWALESSVETADSMSARGMGLRGRSQFTIFYFTNKDKLIIIFVVLSLGVIGLGIYSHTVYTYYYPVLAMNKIGAIQIALYGLYGIFTTCPLWISIFEEVRWKYYVQKM